MNRTSIEWARNPDGSPGYTWSPITGCLNHSSVTYREHYSLIKTGEATGLCKGGGFPCYAYKLANTRLKSLYLANSAIAPFNFSSYEALNILDRNNRADPFYPRLWEDRLSKLERLPSPDTEPKGKGIFVCDMGDLFGLGVPEEWTRQVLSVISNGSNNHHRFYILTKQAQRLPEFSPFPENCFVGVTATNQQMMADALFALHGIKARVKYDSFEPLLDKLSFDTHKNAPIWFRDLGWVIIGACTGTEKDMIKVCQDHPELTLCGAPRGKWTAQPPIEWVREIEDACTKAGIPYFEKDNLQPLLQRELVQELPQ